MRILKVVDKKRTGKETLTLGDIIQGVIKREILCSSIIETSKVEVLSAEGVGVNKTRRSIDGLQVPV